MKLIEPLAWVFVDLGFAQAAKSCGLLAGDGKPKEISFSQLRTEVMEIVAACGKPLNRTPPHPALSPRTGGEGKGEGVALGPYYFETINNEKGNPTGRKIERREKQTRYWYVGLGCSVLVAATYLLRSIHDARPVREIRLFEGLASFKHKDARSSHGEDVLNLRKIIWEGASKSGCIVPPQKLAASQGDIVLSAFVVDRHHPSGGVLPRYDADRERRARWPLLMP